MRTYLVTGGAGFVGSSVAVRIKRDHPDVRVIALDNLRRRGSELNVARLAAAGVEFVHGDIRRPEDLAAAARVECLIECSAEPSVLAGYTSSPEYVVNTNLIGTLNCLELARRHDAAFVFVSTSRVYPVRAINELAFMETATRYELTNTQLVRGASSLGVAEEFPLDGTRSLYGATKLASELIVQEYVEMYGLRAVINRCGVLTGPWQMGTVEQGVVALWVARHVFGGPLSYIGYGGMGKQVRDILHVEDFCRLLDVQMARLDGLRGQVFNVGGGRLVSLSLCELTRLCQDATGRRLAITPVPETRPADVRVYLSDYRKVNAVTGWAPTIGPAEIVSEIAAWLRDHRAQLEPVLARS